MTNDKYCIFYWSVLSNCLSGYLQLKSYLILLHIGRMWFKLFANQLRYSNRKKSHDHTIDLSMIDHHLIPMPS